MKILWFEVTVPSAYTSGGVPIGGWQDSLERIIRTVPEIELTIAFMSEIHADVKVVDKVTYIPIYAKRSSYERKFCKYFDVFVKKMLPGAGKIIEEIKPDLIHIFGTEWPFGQIAAYTKIPVVIHIMGATIPYNNAGLPPNYSYLSLLWHNKRSFINLFHIWQNKRNSMNGEFWERKTWSLIDNYMGRTQWDESLSRVMHPGRRYFHVEEALRTDFLSETNKWKFSNNGKIRLFSTGCSSYWKGPDMMLKVAKILKNLNVGFEWNVAGNMSLTIKRIIEKQEKANFEDCNVNFLGYKKPEELVQLLCSSTMYVHTAYIENSPNSICEAQSLGLPIISTNVGGISSLVRHDVDGYLIPANDPWQMADAIIELNKDVERMKRYSENGKSFSIARHNDEHIKQQLLGCYNQLISGCCCKCLK